MTIAIRKATPMLPSRPCRWCLALQHDGVFADFDLDERGCVVLVRISFDGYGCCPTPTARSMSLETSRIWIGLVGTDDVDTNAMQTILSDYFRENSDVIWSDALQEHSLL